MPRQSGALKKRKEAKHEKMEMWKYEIINNSDK